VATNSQPRLRIGGFVTLCLLATPCPHIFAGARNTAQITSIIHDVRLLAGKVEPLPASLHDEISEGTAVATGAESGAELTFTDQTVARVGSNTVFSFKKGTRSLLLRDGAILLQVPKTAKGARLEGAGVAAVISGTTVMFECHAAIYKFVVLEGTGRLYRPGHLGDSVLVRPGQLMIGQPNTAVSDPVDFDIERFLRTSRFLLDFPPLRSESLMANESRRQQRDKSRKRLLETNMVIFGSGASVSLLDPAQPALANPSGTSSAAPAPVQRSSSIDSPVVDRVMAARR
jgi:hypothetical protein